MYLAYLILCLLKWSFSFLNFFFCHSAAWQLTAKVKSLLLFACLRCTPLHNHPECAVIIPMHGKKREGQKRKKEKWGNRTCGFIKNDEPMSANLNSEAPRLLTHSALGKWISHYLWMASSYSQAAGLAESQYESLSHRVKQLLFETGANKETPRGAVLSTYKAGIPSLAKIVSGRFFFMQKNIHTFI